MKTAWSSGIGPSMSTTKLQINLLKELANMMRMQTCIQYIGSRLVFQLNRLGDRNVIPVLFKHAERKPQNSWVSNPLSAAMKPSSAPSLSATSESSPSTSRNGSASLVHSLEQAVCFLQELQLELMCTESSTENLRYPLTLCWVSMASL